MTFRQILNINVLDWQLGAALALLFLGLAVLLVLTLVGVVWLELCKELFHK